MLGAADLRGGTRRAVARRSAGAGGPHRQARAAARPCSDSGIDEAMAAIRRDKKVVHGTLHYVLATGIGTDRRR